MSIPRYACLNIDAMESCQSSKAKPPIWFQLSLVFLNNGCTICLPILPGNYQFLQQRQTNVERCKWNSQSALWNLAIIYQVPLLNVQMGSRFFIFFTFLFSRNDSCRTIVPVAVVTDSFLSFSELSYFWLSWQQWLDGYNEPVVQSWVIILLPSSLNSLNSGKSLVWQYLFKGPTRSINSTRDFSAFLR